MALKSWLASANDPGTDFPLDNLPYGAFQHAENSAIGVAIGDQILSLSACASRGLLAGLPGPLIEACRAMMLNSLMTLGPSSWSALRRAVTGMLDRSVAPSLRARVEPCLLPMAEAVMLLPARIGDYTDFYASIHHATRVGKLFRPESPLLPNYKYVPIGYHGRASSIIVSGTEIGRPCGQIKRPEAEPVYAPSRSLDYELEVGAFVGWGSSLGQPIPIGQAEERIFGLCLVNDWSARDIQSWEYQPLGPFLAKSFATTISPWVIPLEALRPYRVAEAQRAPGDPQALPYLTSTSPARDGIDLKLEVELLSRKMHEAGMQAALVSQSNLRDLYWTLRQLVTHHTSNGCNLRPGDLIATGTISGAEEGSEGCLLEMKHRAKPLTLPTGEQRKFLEDGDEVTFRAFAQRDDLPRIGFGECTGRVGRAEEDRAAK